MGSIHLYKRRCEDLCRGQSLRDGYARFKASHVDPDIDRRREAVVRWGHLRVVVKLRSVSELAILAVLPRELWVQATYLACALEFAGPVMPCIGQQHQSLPAIQCCEVKVRLPCHATGPATWC